MTSARCFVSRVSKRRDSLNAWLLPFPKGPLREAGPPSTSSWLHVCFNSNKASQSTTATATATTRQHITVHAASSGPVNLPVGCCC